MFRALDKLNQEIISYILTEELGEKAREIEAFCPNPTCRRRLLLRICTTRTDHFAHYPKKACDTNEEPETDEHDKLKKVIFEKLKRRYPYEKIKYEEWLENQRADLFLPKRNIAIECQCSPISKEMFIKRNVKYKTKNISVLWIFGEKFWSEHEDYKERSLRTRDAQKYLFQIYGRFYIYHKNTLLTVHLHPLRRWSKGFAYSGFSLHEIEDNELFIIPNINNTNQARFADRKWW